MSLQANNFDRYFTPVSIAPAGMEITHCQEIWTVGSCFSDEIGRRMAAGGFRVQPNPLGTLFNPASICRQLQRVISGEPYTADDLIERDGLWHSLDFHTSFSAPDSSQVLHNINGTIYRLHSALPSLERLIVTLGSARAFRLKSNGTIVANCHKLPADNFEVADLSEDEIYKMLSTTLKSMREAAPAMKVIVTVSPIRHKAYGLHTDKLSKARLLLAADRLCAAGEAEYFPAYEIMSDELRDYRFYASDMIHPSEEAAEHIYRRFSETYFSASTTMEAARRRKEHLRSLHRPHNPSTNS